MLSITQALSESALSQVRQMLFEYAQMPGVAPCWQDFEHEVASLPGRYAPPEGRLLLAHREDSVNGQVPVGCVALRKLEAEICEMKRLYVRPGSRGNGAGRKLAEMLIAEARSIGYTKMRLDTLPIMREAHQLYRALGFCEIPPYTKNPVPGALFFELDLH